MKNLRRLIPMLLLFLLLLSACSGEEKQQENELAESYRSVAQSFLNDGDLASARKTLEEGIERTGDESLQQMLATMPAEEEITTAASTEPPTELPTELPTEPPATEPPTQAAILENYKNGLTWDMGDTENIKDMYYHAIFRDGYSSIYEQSVFDGSWSNTRWYYSTYGGDRYLMVEYSIFSEDGHNFYEVVFRELDPSYAEVVEFWRNGQQMDAGTTQIYLDEWERKWIPPTYATEESTQPVIVETATDLPKEGTYFARYGDDELRIYSVSNTEIIFEYIHYSAIDPNKVASVGVVTGIVDQANRRADGTFADDGWGHSGKVSLDYYNMDSMGCLFVVCKYSEPDYHGFGPACDWKCFVIP